MSSVLGPSHTIRFAMEDGLLSQATLGMHRKSPILIAETLSGAAPSGGVEDSYSVTGPDGQAFLRAGQPLSTGKRILELHHDQSGNTTTARLDISFDLEAPLVWRLHGPAPFRRAASGCAEQDVEGRTALAVTAESVDVDADGSCVVALDAGHHIVTVSVSSSPVFRCGRTAIACRPNQLREAAIAASLLPDEPFSPIIPIAAPPQTVKSYLAAYATFAEAQADFMSAAGTSMAMEELEAAGDLGEQQSFELLMRMNSTREQLSPFRFWVKYSAMVHELLDGLGIDRVILLHAFSDDDLIIADPGPSPKHDIRLFSAIGDKIAIDTGDLTTLSNRLCQALGRPVADLGDSIDVDADDHHGFVTALFVALQTGQPIRVVRHSATDLTAALHTMNKAGDEAVLIELNGSIDSVIGAQYAAYRRARLVTVPEPDLATVQQAVAERQREIAAAAQQLGTAAAAPKRVRLNRLADMMTGANPLLPIEDAVTAQVPARAVDEVGDRRLTAFTAGLPYSFLRRGANNWSTKPIGHVAADASLIILNEIYCEGRQREGGRFALVFDPGFFRRSETPAVLEAVRSYYTYPILLSGSDANNANLIALPIHLPVELIFFNTHGADESIILQNPLGGVHPITRSKITAWLHLSHRPIIINNSCQSWTAVGRDFIRVGARGYVGTLWSVPAEAAATIGENLIQRVTTGDMPIAEAIPGIEGGGITAHSYIYAGTVNARLDRWPDRHPAPGEIATRETRILIDAAQHADPQVKPLLMREIATVRAMITHAEISPSIDHLDLLLDELSLLAGLHDSEIPVPADTVTELFSRVDALLESLDLPSDVEREKTAIRLMRAAQFAEISGDVGSALRDFQRAAELATGRGRAIALHRVAATMIQIGEWQEAVPVLEESRSLFETASDNAGYVETTGTIGQLYKRLGRLDEAMQCARDGFVAAAHLDDAKRRQSVFKNDESFIHEINGDLDAAMTAVLEGLRLARQTSYPRFELGMLGRLVSVRIKRDELDSAERDAVRGLQRAESLGIAKEVASFHHDLANINQRRGLLTAAIGHDAMAIQHAVKAGQWQFASGVCAELTGLIFNAEEDFDFAAFCVWTLRVTTEDPPLLGRLFHSFGLALMRTATASPEAAWSDIHAGLADLFSGTQDALRDIEPVRHPLALMRSLLNLLVDWRAGAARDDLSRRAQQLDAETQSMFILSEFVALDPAATSWPPPINWA